MSQPERIPIGSDHAGFELKEKLEAVLTGLGYAVDDVGTHSTASTDYPDYAHPVAAQVEEGRAKRGILLCGTGLGMSYAAIGITGSARRSLGRRKWRRSHGSTTIPMSSSSRRAS